MGTCWPRAEAAVGRHPAPPAQSPPRWPVPPRGRTLGKGPAGPRGHSGMSRAPRYRSYHCGHRDRKPARRSPADCGKLGAGSPAAARPAEARQPCGRGSARPPQPGPPGLPQPRRAGLGPEGSWPRWSQPLPHLSSDPGLRRGSLPGPATRRRREARRERVRGVREAERLPPAPILGADHSGDRGVPRELSLFGGASAPWPGPPPDQAAWVEGPAPSSRALRPRRSSCSNSEPPTRPSWGSLHPTPTSLQG